MDRATHDKANILIDMLRSTETFFESGNPSKGIIHYSSYTMSTFRDKEREKIKKELLKLLNIK